MRPNKGQLVSQHLENISRTALEKYQNILKEYVKGRHGVYALYSKEKRATAPYFQQLLVISKEIIEEIIGTGTINVAEQKVENVEMKLQNKFGKHTT